MASPEQGARILPWPRAPAPHKTEREFLPAALEIIETPASPLGRGIVLAVLAFFCAALAWSWLGRVDIIATAQGRLVPSGRVKVVQPLEQGIVREIRVQDGDVVHAGDLLVALDGTAATADCDRLAHDLASTDLDIARLLSLRSEGDPGKATAAFKPPKNAAREEIEMARSLTFAQADEQVAKLAAIDQQIEQKRAEAAEVHASIDKLAATLPLLQEKDSLRGKLLQSEYGNRFAWLDAEQALLEAKQDLIVEGRRVLEAEAAITALQRQHDQTRAEYARKVLSDLSDSEQKAAEQTQDLIKAKRKLAETELRAPIDGTVQELSIHTLGGVVTPAQQLLVIVPDTHELVLEAMVSNADVGFVHAGQDVEVKVETFNFTRYGLIHGHVIGISPDAVTADRRQGDDNAAQAEGRSSQEEKPASASPAYVARVALESSSMLIDGNVASLRPGMAATAEIKTGSRRILEYLLSPLRQSAQEAIRER